MRTSPAERTSLIAQASMVVRSAATPAAPTASAVPATPAQSDGLDVLVVGGAAACDISKADAPVPDMPSDALPSPQIPDSAVSRRERELTALLHTALSHPNVKPVLLLK